MAPCECHRWPETSPGIVRVGVLSLWRRVNLTARPGRELSLWRPLCGDRGIALAVAPLSLWRRENFAAG